MDSKVLENELKNLKVRQGPLYKRSKFLKEWRQRWVVLTMNFLFTFTNKSCKEVTQVIDLKQMKSYKSYLRKDDEMVPSGFKIRSEDNEYYFCGKSANQKWSWIVTLQRLMDYKYTGSSTYNNIDFIKTKGFISQIDFQNLKSGDKIAQLPLNKKQQPKKSAQEASKQVDIQVDKILKELENQKQQLKIKQLEFSEKQKLLKDQQEALKKQQEDNQRLLNKKNEQKNNQQPKPTTVQPIKESPTKEEKTQTIRNSVPSGSKVSELKNLFEQKMVQSSKQTAPAYKLGFNQNKNQKSKSKNDQLYSYRSKTVASLFQEFHTESPEPEALKFILAFLVKMASDQKYGYSSSIIAQIKTHNNRTVLAQILMELITDFKDYQNCDLFAKFVETCLVNTASLFNLNSINIIQNKFNDIFLSIDNEDNLQIMMRTMFILNRIQKYQKNSAIKEKLTKLTKEAKRQENKNWARKLVDLF